MIYLDNLATTPCDPKVVQAMLPYLNSYFGNPASLHSLGKASADAIEKAQNQTAELIGGDAKELVFTSGATESNNLAILGAARSYARTGGTRRRIVTTHLEHKSVLGPIEKLKTEGWDVSFLPLLPDKSGLIDIEVASELIDEETFMVSVQLANSEIGTIQPISRLARIAHANSAIVHCDASQAVGKIPVDVTELDIELLAFSSHKMYGPKGVGVLWVSESLGVSYLEPLMYGGKSGNTIRPGTIPVHQIVGAGVACEITLNRLLEDARHTQTLRDDFERILLSSIPSLCINGMVGNRLPNNSSITFLGLDADLLLANTSDVMASTSSACEAGSLLPSRVLKAINLSDDDAYSTIRFGFGRYNESQEVWDAATLLANSAIHLQTNY